MLTYADACRCGIFSFLPIAKQPDVFDKFFANPHTTDLSAVAAGAVA
jgi:2-succinyl-5-enolpyruvyl-6-hydroxy-3-cyclohexene-1-carboxylate synthase